MSVAFHHTPQNYNKGNGFESLDIVFSVAELIIPPSNKCWVSSVHVSWNPINLHIISSLSTQTAFKMLWNKQQIYQHFSAHIISK